MRAPRLARPEDTVDGGAENGFPGWEHLEGLVGGSTRAVPEMLRRHGVALLAVHGSTARGRRHGDSDLDLAVLFAWPREQAWWRLERNLLHELQDLLLPTVELDLVALNHASPVIQHQVAEHGIPLFEDLPGRWTEYRIRTRHIWELEKKHLDRRWRALRAEYGHDVSTS